MNDNVKTCQISLSDKLLSMTNSSNGILTRLKNNLKYGFPVMGYSRMHNRHNRS